MRRTVKMILVVSCAALLVLGIVAAVIPRVDSVEAYPWGGTEIAMPKALEEELAAISAEDPKTMVEPGELLVVRLSAPLLGECDHYLLPYGTLDARAVPSVGAESWTARMDVLTAVEGNRWLAALSRWKVTELTFRLETGANTAMHGKLETGGQKAITSQSRKELAFDTFTIPLDEPVCVHATVGAWDSQRALNTAAVAAGNWFFTLTMNGQEIYEGGVSCQMEYLENAK